MPKNVEQGLTLIELLVVIAIIGILVLVVLASISSSRNKAYDVRIKNAVNQLRYEAEIVYNSNNASYEGWTTDPGVINQINILRDEIDDNYGDAAGPPYVTVLRDSQEKDFCVSAPLRASAGSYICIDANAQVRQTSAACPDYPVDGPALVCPQ